MRTVLLAILCLLPATAREWKIAYFFDNARETLHFADIAFPSATRGIAVGTIIDEVGEHAPKHIAVLTIDGGVTWTEVKLSEEPRSLFFLNDSIGWLVTDKGLWKTDESGRSWRRLYKNSTLVSVWFLDEMHGFAVGAQKTFIETNDGGVTWKPVELAKNGPGAKNLTSFTSIAFANNKMGIVVGLEYGTLRPTTIELETEDAGANWHIASAVLNGALIDLKLLDKSGFALFSYARNAEIPSEVFRLDLQNGKTGSVYRRKDRRIFSVTAFPNQTFLAAVEKPARENPRARLPSRVHIMESADLKTWDEYRVDYRAYATGVVSAGFDADHMFVATDSGMILRLQ
jgi:hypothetical protein